MKKQEKIKDDICFAGKTPEMLFEELERDIKRLVETRKYVIHRVYFQDALGWDTREIEVWIERDETDYEAKTRIAREKGLKEKKKKDKAEADAKKEAKERETYERLKKKFEQ